MIEKIKRNGYCIYYDGPGWYACGLKIHDKTDAKPNIQGVAWIDIEHEEEVNKMIDEGCPHSHDIVEEIPIECTTHKISFLGWFKTRYFKMINWWKLK